MRRSDRVLGVIYGALLCAACGLPACSTGQRPAVLEEPKEAAVQAPPAVAERIEQQREINKKSGVSNSIGFNPVLLRPVERLAGTVVPRDLAQRMEKQAPIAKEMLRLDLEARDEFIRRINPSAIDRLLLVPELRMTCAAGKKSWDWRRSGAVSPVKDQQCGNCWAYASAAALESSYLIRNTLLIDVSEQYIVNCAADDAGNDAGSCGGGWHPGVFEYMISHGVADEASLHDSGTDGTCDANTAAPYRAVAWDYVTAPAPATGYGDSIPTVDSIKQALCAHGPLAAGVLATSSFQAYTGTPDDVFKETLPESTLAPTWPDNGLKYHALGVNHDILLIGWDDGKHAWLMKNSWGTGWGTNAGLGSSSDKGYMWIDYGSNNIGLGAAWVQAKHRAYKIPPIYLQKFPPRIPFPDPGPLRLEDLTPLLMRRR